MTSTTTPNPAYDPNDIFWQASHPGVNVNKYTPPNYGQAIAQATAIVDRGDFHFLAHETRELLINIKMGKLSRFLESIYFADFKSGPITAKQAAELLLSIHPTHYDMNGKEVTEGIWKKPSFSAMYQHCLKMLELLADFQDFLKPIIEDLRLFPEMPIEQKEKAPHRPEKVYYIPAAVVLNDLITQKPTYISFPARALDDDKTYKAFVWKKPIIEKGKVAGKQADLCKAMNISRRTLKRYTFIAGVRTEPIYTYRRLSSREIARLPKNRKEQRKSKQHFNRVRDEHGTGALANLDDITRLGLNGHLFCLKRVGSKLIDESFEAGIVQPTFIQAEMNTPPAVEDVLIIKNAHLVFTVGKTDNKSPQQGKKTPNKRGKHATGSSQNRP